LTAPVPSNGAAIGAALSGASMVAVRYVAGVCPPDSACGLGSLAVVPSDGAASGDAGAASDDTGAGAASGDTGGASDDTGAAPDDTGAASGDAGAGSDDTEDDADATEDTSDEGSDGWLKGGAQGLRWAATSSAFTAPAGGAPPPNALPVEFGYMLLLRPIDPAGPCRRDSAVRTADAGVQRRSRRAQAPRRLPIRQCHAGRRSGVVRVTAGTA
jgi:hypothetical protein